MPAHNAIDKTGIKFNMLEAIERIPNYKNSKTYYRCICKCGNTIIIPNDRVGKTYSCGCVSKKGISQRQDYTGRQFNKLTVLEMLYGYKYGHTYARCMCECGNETIAHMGNIKSGKTKSCGCIETSSRFGRKNHEKDLTNMRFGHLTVLELSTKRFSNGSVGWLCKCDCGNETIVRSGNLLRGKTRSCGCNKTSKLEEYVEEILDLHNIRYDREYKFIDCKNKHQLPFDFHFIQNGIEYCIECQGKQHYEPVKHFGGDIRFKATKKNDAIKMDYCKNNNITLICLPYILSKLQMESEIMNVLNPVTTTA